MKTSDDLNNVDFNHNNMMFIQCESCAHIIDMNGYKRMYDSKIVTKNEVRCYNTIIIVYINVILTLKLNQDLWKDSEEKVHLASAITMMYTHNNMNEQLYTRIKITTKTKNNINMER